MRLIKSQLAFDHSFPVHGTSSSVQINHTLWSLTPAPSACRTLWVSDVQRDGLSPSTKRKTWILSSISEKAPLEKPQISAGCNDTVCGLSLCSRFDIQQERAERPPADTGRITIGGFIQADIEIADGSVFVAIRKAAAFIRADSETGAPAFVIF